MSIYKERERYTTRNIRKEVIKHRQISRFEPSVIIYTVSLSFMACSYNWCSDLYWFRKLKVCLFFNTNPPKQFIRAIHCFVFFVFVELFRHLPNLIKILLYHIGRVFEGTFHPGLFHGKRLTAYIDGRKILVRMH